MTIGKKTLILSTTIVLALAMMAWVGYDRQSKEIEQLQTQIDELTVKDREAEVAKRISQQMEDIAYEQKRISDTQRDKALQMTHLAQEQRKMAEAQTLVANRMRATAEEERRNALDAEMQATRQRKIAEEQRRSAEEAKRKADTLSYISLARSLGTLSENRFTTGEPEIAALLAYYAWYFSDKYGGDTHHPSIYNALALSSGNIRKWSVNRGGITDIVPYDGQFITSTNYGEITIWKTIGEEMTSRVIFEDKSYDFRDLYYTDNMLYALTRDGRIVRWTKSMIEKEQNPKAKVKNAVTISLSPKGNGNFRQMTFDESHIITSSGTEIYILEKISCRILRHLEVSAPVTFINNIGKDQIVFFTSDGIMHKLTNCEIIKPMLDTGAKDICSFAANDQYMAWGTHSGDIYLADYPNYSQIKHLRGHRSEVAKLKFVDYGLISSSYDCTLKLWNPSTEKPDPVNLYAGDEWIRCFYAAHDNYIWTGDAMGNLTRLDVRPESMAAKIRAELKRDFTANEWDYYIGERRAEHEEL